MPIESDPGILLGTLRPQFDREKLPDQQAREKGEIIQIYWSA